jgi:tetratricopeptide (TPR) repeat protein
MAANTQADETASTSAQATAGRLRPAEVHSIMRQQLERLAVPWGLEPTEVYRLTRQMRAHTYAPGEIIMPYGVRADFMGLIVRGQVAVYGDQHKGARQVAVLLPGITVGDLTPERNRASDATLQALTRCEVWFLRRAELEALAKERRAQRRTAAYWGLLGWSAVVLLLCLLAIMALSLPSVRQTAALVPMGIGELCRERGKGNDAPATYDRCVERAWTVAADLAPADANPLLALGTFYFERGALEAAGQAFEAAGNLAPDLAEVQNNLGLIYARQGKHEEAIAAFEQALELEPGIAAVEHNLGSSLQALGAYDEALNHYELALAFGEPRASTLANLAIGYYETGQPDKALETAREALEYDGTLAPAHTVLGAVALESRQPEAALSHLQQAIALENDYSQAYFYLGVAHKALDQPAEAIAAFEQALATTGDEGMRAQIRQHLKELYEAEEQDGSPQ